MDLSNVDQVPSNAHLCEKESQLYIFEDNEAVIKMIIKGRSPSMRHVSRTHRVALDWLLTEKIWTHRFRKSMSTPNTKLQTFTQKAVSPVRSGTTCCISLTS